MILFLLLSKLGNKARRGTECISFYLLCTLGCYFEIQLWWPGARVGYGSLEDLLTLIYLDHFLCCHICCSGLRKYILLLCRRLRLGHLLKSLKIVGLELASVQKLFLCLILLEHG